MSESMLDKWRIFVKSGAVKSEMENAIELLKRFRETYPFVENPGSIETLSPDDIFKEQPSEVGEFFHWLEYYLYPIGHLTIYGSKVYRQIRSQFEDFKELLYTVVDRKKSLVEKVDAQWDEIKHLGGDRHIGKKIIFCFNFETEEILPIFKTSHLEYFFDNIADRPEYTWKYASMTLGEKYHFLNSEIIKVKKSFPETMSCTIPYFARFLYDFYPPPRLESTESPNESTKLEEKLATEQKVQFRNFMILLNELRSKNKISAEELRLYRKQWENYPQGRESLFDQLTALKNK